MFITKIINIRFLFTFKYIKLQTVYNKPLESNVLNYLLLLPLLFINIIQPYLYFIYSSLFTLSFVILYLDDFRLSCIRFFKLVQIFSFIILPLYMLYITYYLNITVDIVNYIKDKDDVHLHGHVSIDKEGAKMIGQGLNTIGS